jgi:ADP-heptose:LPS heptosyltransferase
MDGPKIAQLGAILDLSPPPLPVVWVAQADRDRAAELLRTDRPIIVLAPTANWQPKVWAADRFAEAFRRLSASTFPNALPVILGGPGAAETATPLLAALPEACNLVGALSLPEAQPCYKRLPCS